METVEHAAVQDTPAPEMHPNTALMLPPDVADLLEELSQYAPPEGVLVAPTASMAMGRKAKKILTALRAEEALHALTTDAGVAKALAEKWRRLASMGCVNALDSALEEALSVGRASAPDSWVPVSWGLPAITENHFRDDVAYLVATEDGRVLPAWHVCGTPNTDGYTWRMDDEGRQHRSWISLMEDGRYHDRIVEGVTHWKVLPAGPVR